MGKLRQAQTAVACSLGSLILGLLYVWPSYTLQVYKSNTTNPLTSPISDFESSLLGSLPSLGSMVGSAIVGWILKHFGRQKGGLVLAVPVLISWIMIDMTSSSTVIMIARFLGGISGGAFLVHAPIFISEIAEKSIRGTLASAPMACYCTGVLLSYVLGWLLSYSYVIWTNIAFCLLYIALMMTVTESPVFLLRQQRDGDARQAIAHYRGVTISSKVVLEEYSRIKQQITPAIELIAVNSDAKAEEAEKEKLNIINEENEQDQKISSFKMLFVSRSSRRGFTVVGLALTFQVMMGMVAVQVYAKDIFTNAAPNLSSHFCSVMFALVLCIGTLLSALFSDRFGRRILLVTSSLAVCLCLSGMGLLLHTNIAPPWVTAVLMLLYCFAFMFGAGSVPYVLLAEVFIPEVQSIASMLLMEWVWLLNFFIVGVFPFMVKFFGIHGSFYCFACFAIVNTIIGLFLVPETKGLSNEQIQETLLKRRK